MNGVFSSSFALFQVISCFSLRSRPFSSPFALSLLFTQPQLCHASGVNSLEFSKIWAIWCEVVEVWLEALSMFIFNHLCHFVLLKVARWRLYQQWMLIRLLYPFGALGVRGDLLRQAYTSHFASWLLLRVYAVLSAFSRFQLYRGWELIHCFPSFSSTLSYLHIYSWA